MGGEVIFFLKFFEGVEENSKFYGGMYFGVLGWGEKEKKKGGKRIEGFLG